MAWVIGNLTKLWLGVRLCSPFCYKYKLQSKHCLTSIIILSETGETYKLTKEGLVISSLFENL